MVVSGVGEKHNARWGHHRTLDRLVAAASDELAIIKVQVAQRVGVGL